MSIVKEYATGKVIVAPNPATNGTSITVENGSAFPDPTSFGEYEIVIWPQAIEPTPNNHCEIVKVTAKTSVGDNAELTIVRAQNETFGLDVKQGWSVYNPALQGGGSGTSNYNDLSNKPKIDGVTLQGNKTLADLGITNYDDTALSKRVTNNETAIVNLANLATEDGVKNIADTSNARNATEFITSETNDGKISIKYTDTIRWSSTYLGKAHLENGKSYIISVDEWYYGRIGISNTAAYYPDPPVYHNEPDVTVTDGEGSHSLIHTAHSQGGLRKSSTFTSNADQDIYFWFCSDDQGITPQDFTFSLMLREVSSADSTYQPYAKTNRELTLELQGGRNLLPVASAIENNGISFMINSDGTILLNGTSLPGHSYLNFDQEYKFLAGATYRLSCGLLALDSSGASMQIIVNNVAVADSYNLGYVDYTPTVDTVGRIVLVVRSNNTLNNLVVEPMMTLGGVNDTSYTMGKIDVSDTGWVQLANKINYRKKGNLVEVVVDMASDEIGTDTWAVGWKVLNQGNPLPVGSRSSLTIPGTVLLRKITDQTVTVVNGHVDTSGNIQVNVPGNTTINNTTYNSARMVVCYPV